MTLKSSLVVKQQKKRLAAVNTSRDKAFLQHAAYTRSQVEGYEIDPQLSNKKGTVYKNKKTGKVTIAFAGTQVGKKNIKQGLKDIGADINIAFGQEKHSEEFKKADRQYQAVIKKYGMENVDVTGHSLGGTKAAYLSHKYGVNAETYNMGASVFGTEKWDMRNVTAHITTGDVVPVGVYELRHQGSGVHIVKHHGKVKEIIEDEIIKQVAGAPEGMLKKHGVTTAGEVLSEAAHVIPRAVGGALKKGGELAPIIAGVEAVADVEGKLHSSSQFVPKGTTDAAMSLNEKPPDSKPISAPPPARIQKPIPAVIQKPVPPPPPVPSMGLANPSMAPQKPAEVPTTGHAPHSRYYHMNHVGNTGSF